MGAVSDWMLISVCLVACVSVQAQEIPDVQGLVEKLKTITDQLMAINKAYSSFVQESAKGVESAGPDDGGDEVEEELEDEEEIEGEGEVEEGEDGGDEEGEEGDEEAEKRHRRRMRRRRMRRMRMM